MPLYFFFFILNHTMPLNVFFSNLTSYCLYDTLNFIRLIFVPPSFPYLCPQNFKEEKNSQKHVPSLKNFDDNFFLNREINNLSTQLVLSSALPSRRPCSSSTMQMLSSSSLTSRYKSVISILRVAII